MAFHWFVAARNFRKASNDFDEGNESQGYKNLTKAAVGAVIPFGGLLVECVLHNPILAAHQAWDNRDDIADTVQDIFS